MNKNLLFITCYNCENQIVRVLQSLANNKVQAYFQEILVINNISTDNTESVAIEKAKTLTDLPITIIRNKENYNLGGSQKVAFNYAIENDFDYVTILHGDDQGDISNLMPFLNEQSTYKYDSFLGSRFMLKSQTFGYSLFRLLGNIAVNTYTSLLTGRVIKDMGAGLNMYKVSYLKSRFYLHFPNSLNFNVYMLLYGIFSKSSFTFFPLAWKEEDQVSNAKIFKQGFEILKLFALYLFNKKSALKENKSLFAKPYEFTVIYKSSKIKND